jgi:hypothetical protein
MYTVEDYEKARVELHRWQELWGNYSGNNPNKYQTDIRDAGRRVREIEQYLKDAGIFERNESEQLEIELDRMFPNAQKREVVEYNGKKYRREFWPLEKSRSGKTVKAWGKSWLPVEGS